MPQQCVPLCETPIVSFLRAKPKTNRQQPFSNSPAQAQQPKKAQQPKEKLLVLASLEEPREDEVEPARLLRHYHLHLAPGSQAPINRPTEPGRAGDCLGETL